MDEEWWTITGTGTPITEDTSTSILRVTSSIAGNTGSISGLAIFR